jgi:hypothetical protein
LTSTHDFTATTCDVTFPVFAKVDADLENYL